MKSEGKQKQKRIRADRGSAIPATFGYDYYFVCDNKAAKSIK